MNYFLMKDRSSSREDIFLRRVWKLEEKLYRMCVLHTNTVHKRPQFFKNGPNRPHFLMLYLLY